MSNQKNFGHIRLPMFSLSANKCEKHEVFSNIFIQSFHKCEKDFAERDFDKAEQDFGAKPKENPTFACNKFTKLWTFCDFRQKKVTNILNQGSKLTFLTTCPSDTWNQMSTCPRKFPLARKKNRVNKFWGNFGKKFVKSTFWQRTLNLQDKHSRKSYFANQVFMHDAMSDVNVT